MEDLIRFVIYASFIIYSIFCEDDDDCISLAMFADIPNNSLEKIVGYAENTIPLLTVSQFREHFRIVLATFEHLLGQIAVHLLDDNLQFAPVGRSPVDARKQLLIGLWVLANRETFRPFGERFGVAKSTAWQCSNRLCAALLKLNQEQGIICWPNAVRMRAIINGFQEKWGFPGVIGAIDGSHIPIPAPRRHQLSYINRKGFHSILLQGVCDHNMLFIDCYSGEVGSIHDALLFKRSDLYSRIENRDIHIPDDAHLIGDSAYPLSQSLIVPFKANRNITREETRFNKVLSSARQVIERSYGLLKGRFRRLYYLDMQRVDQIPLVIIACCILHNVCILEGDWEWIQYNDDDEAASNPEAPPLDDDDNGANNNVLNVDPLNRPQGVLKRNAIKVRLNQAQR